MILLPVFSKHTMILRRLSLMMMSTTHINSIHTENGSPVPLLAKISSSRPGGEEQAVANRFRTGVVYLHGFPDMSVHPTTGDFASRVPRKLCEAVTKRLGDEAVFVCFNFSGLPGSDTTMSFESKTVSKEVSDAEAVVRHVIDDLLVPAGGSVHVVGLSTGAIIAALLRNKNFGETKFTVTCIAGLLDVKAGAQLDFSPEQITDFEQKGFCMKEFWIPPECPMPEGDEDSMTVVQEPENPTQSTKILLKLNKDYFDEFMAEVGGVLDVANSVQTGTAPLLIMHGTNDIHVPIENGEQLFEAATEPKSFFKMEQATHLLSNSKHMKKATSRIIQFIQENEN